MSLAAHRCDRGTSCEYAALIMTKYQIKKCEDDNAPSDLVDDDGTPVLHAIDMDRDVFQLW